MVDVFRYLLQIPSVRENVLKQGSNTIQARFAADGRKTSAKIGSVMSVFNLVDEGNGNVDHQYTVALYNGKEDYEELINCMRDVFDELRVLEEEGFLYEGKQIFIEWICCCDWKFLALVYGLNAACSEYFCIWCYCTKALISCLDIQDWPIARTVQDIKKLCKGNSMDQRKGCISQPLLSIPLTSVVPDTLHLFLRIMGLLFNQVVDKVLEAKQDQVLLDEMERIGVPFKFFNVQEQGERSTTKFTKLDGKDLKKILDQLDVAKVLNGIHSINGRHVEQLWIGFETLMGALSADPEEENYLTPDEFQHNAREWGKAFVMVNGNQEDVTPYMHALIYHVPQFLAKYGSIHQFSCQPVEKKNHLQNQVFHRASQKGGRGSKYTLQILQRENRSLFAKKLGLNREKRKYEKKDH